MADSRIWGSGAAKPVHMSPDGKMRRCYSPQNCRYKDASINAATHADKDRELKILDTAQSVFHDNLLRLPKNHVAVRDLAERRIPITDPHLGWIPSRSTALRQLHAAGLGEMDLLESGLADLRVDSTALQVFAHDRLTIAVNQDGHTIAYYARAYVDKTGGPRIAKIGDATATMTSGLKYVRSRPPSFTVPPRDPETGRFTAPYENPMFLLDEASPHIRREGRVILVEGQLDALSCWYGGVRNVASIAGMTDFYERQRDECLTALGNSDGTRDGAITLCLDDDEAGLAGARSAIMRFPDDRIHVCIVPDGKDPCDYRAAHGDEALREALSRHEDGMKFLIDRTSTHEIPILLARVTDPVRRRELVSHAVLVHPELSPEGKLGNMVGKLKTPGSKTRPGVYRERRRWVRALGVDAQSTMKGKTLPERMADSERLRLIGSIMWRAHRDGTQVPKDVSIMAPKKLRSAAPSDPIWAEVEPMVIMDEDTDDLTARMRALVPENARRP